MGTIFATERFDVRPWTPDDAEFAFAMYSDPLVIRYLGGPKVPHESVAYSREALGRLIAREHPPGQGMWAIEERATGAVVGSALCVPIEDDPEGRVEIGWHIVRARWGEGIASEAGRGLADYARSLGLARVYALVVPENVASSQVARKTGMTYVGRTTEFYDEELELYILEFD